MSEPGNWEVASLGQIGRFSKGVGGTKEDEVPDGIPCIRYGDLYSKYSTFIRAARSFVAAERAQDYTPIFFGDVLFAGSGETIEEIGKSAVNLLGSLACCGGDVIVLRPFRQIDPRFLGYALDSPDAIDQKARMGKGVTVMHLYASELKHLRISLPSLEEQAAIVRFLDHAGRRIRRAIRAKQQLIALLNEQKQAVIHRAVTRGLDPNVRLKPSGVNSLGDVPAHWEVVRLRRILADRVRNGLYKSREYYSSEGTPMIQMGEAFANPVVSKVAKDRVILTPEEKERWLLHRGDLLFARRSIVFEGSGKCSLVGELPEPHVFESSLIRVRPDKATVQSAFLWRYFGSHFSRSQVLAVTKQVTISGIDGNQLKDLIVLVPPREEQGRILAQIEQLERPIDAAIRTAEVGALLLQEYRTRLIADVVTGKLDVREAAARLPDEVDETEPIDELDFELEDELEVDELEPVEA